MNLTKTECNVTLNMIVNRMIVDRILDPIYDHIITSNDHNRQEIR